MENPGTSEGLVPGINVVTVCLFLASCHWKPAGVNAMMMLSCVRKGKM